MNNKYLSAALSAATNSTNKYFLHGCALFRGGNIIATSFNTSDVFGHAECRLLEDYKGPSAKKAQSA